MSNKNERKLVKVRKSCGYKATEVCKALGIHHSIPIRKGYARYACKCAENICRFIQMQN